MEPISSENGPVMVTFLAARQPKAFITPRTAARMCDVIESQDADFFWSYFSTEIWDPEKVKEAKKEKLTTCVPEADSEMVQHL